MPACLGFCGAALPQILQLFYLQKGIFAVIMIYRLKWASMGAARPSRNQLLYEGNLIEMPTVIERIAAAEADAESLRRNAQEAARNAETAAEDEAAKSLKIFREEAKAGLALARAMAEKDASAEAARLLESGRAEAERILAAAGSRLGPAAGLIIEKTLNLL